MYSKYDFEDILLILFRYSYAGDIKTRIREKITESTDNQSQSLLRWSTLQLMSLACNVLIRR